MGCALRFPALVALVSADVFLHDPPGSNNRLDEDGGQRINDKRLMDTQNSAEGGYGRQAEPIVYVAGSTLSITWSYSRSSACGPDDECQFVVQYMCNDHGAVPAGLPSHSIMPLFVEGPLRDGTSHSTPDPNNPDPSRGLHEPTSFYIECDARARNSGLYVADQNLNGNDARRTRQNPNGARSGLECPEERDYYPYWHPSPWKDLAIVTTNLELCKWSATESQNVKAKNYCDSPAIPS